VDSLTSVVRSAVSEIERLQPGAVGPHADRVRAALAARGLAANCHVGRRGLTPDETVEWYAGQLLDIVDSKSWFTMNSFINSLDRFVPVRGGG
jgi:hypothetical protein